jgi:hypothetical protein
MIGFACHGGLAAGDIIMLNGDEVFRRAENAVRVVIVEIRPDLKGRWRAVVPKDLGLEADDWLVASRRMVDRFANSLGKPITMSDPARAAYRSQRLIEFVVALANLGDASMRAASPNFQMAGF